MEQEILKLDRNRKRVESCPCGRSNKDGKFVPFCGYDAAGYCHGCGETILPKSDKPIVFKQAEPIEIQSLSTELIRYHADKKHKNHFILGLSLLFGWNSKQIAQKYGIGTFYEENAHPEIAAYNGSVIFFTVDNQQRIRSGKVMYYNPYTLKRVHEVQTTWVHALYKKWLSKDYKQTTKLKNEVAQFQMVGAFYLEHLACANPDKFVAIVESEKTAIIANEINLWPNVVFVASGGSKALGMSRFEPFRGRRIVICRDFDILEKVKRGSTAEATKDELAEKRFWEDKEAELKNHGFDVRFWDNIGNYAPEQKADLADYLIGEQIKKKWGEWSEEEKAELEEFGFLDSYKKYIEKL